MIGRNSHKGKFIPRNPDKYMGNTSNIIYRSGLELRFFNYCDLNRSIVQWASEELSVPYVSPIDKKVHRYFPDVIIKKKTEDGKYKVDMIEIKPSVQTRAPVPPKRRGKKAHKHFLQESMAWEINKAKWKAAKQYCDKKGWDFKIITDKALMPK